jgi:serine/threonine-protein kinase
LEGKGLSANVSEMNSDTVAEGYVISQNPSSGASVAAGSTVTIVVSLGKEEVPGTVPNVVGSQQAAAERSLANAGLSVNVSEMNSDTVAEGYVISQNPSSGASVPEGSTVSLVVSMGKEQVTVPNVVGSQQAVAEQALESKGLYVDVSSEYSNTVSAGQVISQTPEANTKVAAGSTVNLVVSSGKEQVSVPNVVGYQKDAAVQTLEGKGLLVKVSETASESPKGQVISQTPEANTKVAAGSTVTIVVSLGPPPSQETPPSEPPPSQEPQE